MCAVASCMHTHTEALDAHRLGLCSWPAPIFDSMAAAGETPYFYDMNEAQLQQWVEANPGPINKMDSGGYTPLYVAACVVENLPLTVWLLDEKGADVNAARVYSSSLCRLSRHPHCLDGPWR